MCRELFWEDHKVSLQFLAKIHLSRKEACGKGIGA